jgi:amino acid adenylation domain-containing protein
MRTAPPPDAVAIVGMGCRFPGGADSPGRFWELLRDGVDAIVDVPADRFDADALFAADASIPGSIYTRRGGFLGDVAGFDAGFFGISPREARRMDPQHRVLLEVVWDALEDSGHVPERLAGSDAGVYVGISSHDYADLQTTPSGRHLLDAYSSMASAAFTAANRISFLLDLHGPSLAIDSACSSSLTAVHLACRQLARGEGELAIAGAVNLCITPEPMIGLCRAGMLSPDGRSHAFDARANGYVRGEGAGAVVLKPLSRALADGDAIHAVILASAINQDGHTASFSIPSAAAQEAMLRQALRAAGIAPETVQYIEAHGTGTPVGDPQEAQAIGRVFGVARAAGGSCLIGSVKTNIGHLEAAAGMAGLIKTVLALRHRRVPPNLHFVQANPAIRLDELRLRVPTSLEPWPAPPGEAIAGVSSFGFGGSNAHVLLAETTAVPEAVHVPSWRGADDGLGAAVDAAAATGRAHILVVSARTEQALATQAAQYAQLLGASRATPPADVCHAAAVRRTHHEQRLAAVAESEEGLRELLDAYGRGEARAGLAIGRATRHHPPKLAFVFSGMGPQWWGMGRQLLREEPVFRATLEECDRLLTPLAGWSLLEELAADEATSRVHAADLAHVSNLAIQLGLAALWRSWGVTPDAVVGHSSGEMAAACVAGALDLPDVLQLAWHRGRLLQRLSGAGRMLAAGVSSEQAEELIARHAGAVSLAAINSPAGVTLSGTAGALEQIAAELEQGPLFHRFLRVDVPYHGPQMEVLREDLLAGLQHLRPRAPAVRIVSTLTGAWADGEAFGALHWWHNMRQPVQFVAALDRLLEDGVELFVEVGPHPVAAASVLECAAARGASVTVLPTLRRAEDERARMLRTLGELHVRGCSIDWRALYPTGSPVRLPTYPWQHEPYWLESTPAEAPPRPAGVDTAHPLLGRRLHTARPAWEADTAGTRLAFLDDHVVQDSVVFPGAAYVEMALAAARQTWDDASVAAEQLQFLRMLFLPQRDASLLQVHYDPGAATLEVHAAARRDEPKWTLHATARLRAPTADGAPDRVSLDATRARCASALDAAASYALFERHGVRYGPAFRGVRELWLGADEAVGRLALDDVTAADTAAYCVHPALLDAAFQVLGSVVKHGAAAISVPGPIVPTSIAHVEWFGNPGGGCWVHAVLRRRTERGFEGDVSLTDDAGRVLLRCAGLRLEAITAARSESGIDEWLYESHWGVAPLLAANGTVVRTLAAPAAIAAIADAALPGSAEAAGLEVHYQVLEPALDGIALHYARTALRQLQLPVAGGALEDADGAAAATSYDVAPQHRRLLAHLLDALATADRDDAGEFVNEPAVSPGALAARLLADHPDEAPAIELLQRCGSKLADVLRGAADPRELLFGGASDALRRMYRDTPVSRHYNGIAARAVAAAVARADAATPVRILEVGAGTGGFTSALLPHLGEVPVDYLFTDVSPYFLARAREEFAGRPGLRFEVFDAEIDPVEQQSVGGPFDLVVAVNVLHATADVRRSLAHLHRLTAPGGLLVLVEVTRRPLWIELIFGLLDGWWRFADTDIRPHHPLLAREVWVQLLAEMSFQDVAVAADPPRDGGTMQSVFIARRAAPASLPADAAAPRHAASRRRWLILADARGVADAVAARIHARGDTCVLARAGDEFARRAPDRFDIAPHEAAHVARLLAELVVDGRGVDGIVHLWSLDAADAATASTAAVMDAQRRSCGSALDVIHAMRGATPLPELWLVTAGAQDVADGAAPGVTQAPLWGLGRVLCSEQPELRTHLVDLGAECADDELEAFVTELYAGDGGGEIALRGGTRRVRSLRRAPARGAAPEPASLTVSPDDSAFELEIGTPGALETVGLRAVVAVPPPPGHVRVRALAQGVNYRDVIRALGMLPGTAGDGDTAAPTNGAECAGIVVECGAGVTSVRPGDAVVALPFGMPGSHAIVREELVVPLPPGLSFEDASGLGGVYLTAHYGLNHLARITAGERVLIHSAAGGVGHAALEICRRAGAEIFATAGSSQKRDYLRSRGIEHVFDSRSLAWADDLLASTEGQGVDVVLNSLAGAAIPRGLEVLRPFGRFVEIGKRDIYQDAMIGLLPFRRQLAFFSLDLVQLCLERPAFTGALLREVVDLVASGELGLPPRTDFDIAAAEDAYRLMAQARHIGKVVLTTQQAAYRVRPAVAQSLFHGDATYLITGGLGGFGLAVAEWLVAQGARHLVLMTRSGEPKDNAQALRALEQGPAAVHVVRGDVSREADVARVLAGIHAGMPPLRGVLHLAMVLDDALLGDQDHERFRAVMAPKIAGAWNLHRLTAECPLDHFVLFSSVSSMTGHPLQGNYAAANAFLDALAPYRRARGLPAVAISWGTVADVGYVARHAAIAQQLDRLGVQSLTPAQALAVLDHALRERPTNMIAARIDWNTLQRWNRTADRDAHGSTREPAQGAAADGDMRTGTLERLRSSAPDERAALLETWLVQRVAKVLGATPERVETARPMPEMGLDSLLAVELLTVLRIELGVQIAVVKLLEGTSIHDLAAIILQQLALTAADPEVVVSGAIQARATAELSSEQRRFWYLDQLEHGNPAHNLFGAARLSGPLDVPALERSIAKVVERHEQLRAGFTAVDGEPEQMIAGTVDVPLPLVDLRHLPADAREAELQRLAMAEIATPFDLAAPPLLRVLLVRLDEHEHAVLLIVHHIVADAWAMALIVRDVLACYGAAVSGGPSPLPASVPRYADYVQQQRALLESDVAAVQLDYWTKQLAGAPAALSLPSDRAAPDRPAFRSGRIAFELSQETSDALRELSRREGVTLFATLLAAFQTLLHRHTGETDITVGTPAARRDRPGLEELVGCCMNTLALRCDLAGDPSFRELLRRTRDMTLDAFAHQDMPFERVVQALAPERAVGRSPLFRTMLILHNLRWPELHMSGLDVRPLPIAAGASVADITLLVETAERLHGSLAFSAELFEERTAAALLENFGVLLDGITRDPDVTISALPLLAPAQRQRMLVEFNDTAVDEGEDDCLHELVRAQIARTPAGVAVRSEEHVLTYAQLGERATRLAHELHGLGVAQGAVVGVCTERSVELPVALLAVLETGAAFLPLDPVQPRARLGAMLRDADVRVILTQARLRPLLDVHSDAVIVELDGAGHPSSTRSAGERAAATRRPTPDDVAYVIFTSGSTGAPKGVRIPHRAICNQVRWRQRAFPLGAADAVLQRTPIGFDPAIWELFGPLTAGARIVLPRPGRDEDGAYLIALMAEQGVTTLQAVPSLLDALLDEPGLARCVHLQRVFCGGEPLLPALRDRFFATLDATLHNLYGPAETTIDATCWSCMRGDVGPVPIGRPIANVRAYVLDERLQPVPAGVPGELFIAGAGVGLGYSGRSDLTEERFLPDAFCGEPDARMYRTGDVARWRHDGQLEFLGRRDEQVKLRGVRVEPGEVEAVLTSHPAVRQAAVVAHDVAPGDRQLAAFVVTNGDTPAAPEELLRFLSAHLPSIMLPATFVLVEALPRTASGKIDRARLAVELATPAPPRTVQAPRDDIEARLVRIWEELLEVRPIGVADDFFALGGHSLLAMRMLARIHRAFGRVLPASVFVASPTIEALADLLRTDPGCDRAEIT